MDIVITQHNNGYTYTRDTGLAKSAAARDGLVAVPVVRLSQRGRSEMSPEQRFIFGNSFHAMVPEPSVLWVSDGTRNEIRKALAGSDDAARFDAGRCDEGAIIKALGAAEQEYDQEGNILGERLVKGEPSLFGDDPFSKAYREATQHGDVTLAECARELDALAERWGKGGR